MLGLDALFFDTSTHAQPSLWLPTKCIVANLQSGVSLSTTPVMQPKTQVKPSNFRALGYSKKISWFLHLLQTFPQKRQMVVALLDFICHYNHCAPFWTGEFDLAHVIPTLPLGLLFTILEKLPALFDAHQDVIDAIMTCHQSFTTAWNEAYSLHQ
eukprot:1481690-Karenia_brevis.AAC.1